MQALLHTHFWLVKLVGISAALAILASAATTHFGVQRLIDDDSIAAIASDRIPEGQELAVPGDAGRTGAAKPATPDSAGKGLEYLAKNNYFCPKCVPTAESTGEGVVADAELTPGLPPPDPGVVRSSLPYQLVATMESDRPRDSIAVLFHLEHKTSHAHSPGEKIEADVKLKKVERARVILENKGRLEYIDTITPPAPPAAEPVAPPAPVEEEKTAAKSEIPGADEAIKCNGNTCTVSKAFRDQLIANPALLSKQARVIPAMRDGETRGFKFYGIRPGSLPKLFGMKNGDMITAVNGQELKSADEVLGLYTKLRRASRITVSVESRGVVEEKEVIFE
jgi:general secretion pathway protein C